MTTLTTTAAATQAHVTAATIRNWCRRGAVTAIKTAGRWIIDASSLARRITIGTWRNTMAASPTPTPGTMAARGRDYVAAWPTNIARQTGISAEYVAEALTRVNLAAQADANGLRPQFLFGEYVQTIADLTPDQAKAVVAEMQAIRAEIRQAALTHCRCCGLKLSRSGECPSCGDLDF
ncbi:hypothetical protein [Streptomyces vinaceus]|uniref:hypothetical protein n=1 Tax=Streptomyces vinaceus TaxID=1960 RepID=UPI00369FAFBF